MAKKTKIVIDENLEQKSEMFMEKVSSEMHFKSKKSNDLMLFDWVDEIDFACPYIDNIVRNPKLTLFSEEDIVKIEKARKISVASVKDLSIHTHFIEKIDKKTNDVQPSQILIERSEETFNIYENRFVYTLMDNLTRFMIKREEQLNNFEAENDKVLEYAATTFTNNERVNIELKISSKELPQGKSENDLKNAIANTKGKIKRIKDYMNSWQKSEFVKQLQKAHAPFVTTPIRKTNIILKNPNFQFAMKLWNFLRSYGNEEESFKDGLESKGDNLLKTILDDSFLMDYFVFDSISKTKKEQKNKLSKYAIIMIKEQIQRIILVLLNSGIKLTEEEIFNMIANEIKNQNNKILIGSDDVKKKFKNAMEEYLERTQDYL